MQKFLTLSALCAFSSGLVAQVGINTLTPKATLDVVSKGNDPSFPDGILAPRLTKQELANKDLGTYSEAQRGLMVFVSDVSIDPSVAPGKSAKQTEMINSSGFYVFSGNAWDSVVTAVPVVNGDIVSQPLNVKNNGNKKVHLNSSITLPPGKWEVEIFVTLEVSKSIVGSSYNWVKLSFTDFNKSVDLGPTHGNGVKDTQSKDIVSKSKLISGFVNTFGNVNEGDGNNYYGIVNGKMLINNSGGSDGYQDKTYNLYYDNVIYKGASGVEFINLGGSEHLENYIVATRIQ